MRTVNLERLQADAAARVAKRDGGGVAAARRVC
jgi:hypothetical protein